MTALINNGILPTILKDIYFRGGLADSDEKCNPLRRQRQMCIRDRPYSPIIVHSDREALTARCDALYFGSESPAKQQEIINQYQGQALLLMSEQNPECVIGSAFCLIIEHNQVRFSVNLDALARSGVRVNPDVLMLARNKKHE